ncbi:MAG TPA: family 20 glycosylhydrolase [Phycisphaeraceae bacterium]
MVGLRAVHLDFKGCAPTPGRLISLLDLFAAARFNAVLVEWEDKFPWRVDPRFRSPEHYSEQEVDAFHQRAAALGLEIIPLVQTLGHMETVLSVPDYHALREVPDRADGLNPLADGAAALIQRMIDDVIDRTPGLRHFHVGGDEAWTFGTHPQTRAYVERHGGAALFLHFIEPILDRLIQQGIRPLIWHDMIARWEPAYLNRLTRKADVVIWGYHGTPTDDPQQHYNTRVIERLHAQGARLWAGTAYKGPDAFTCDLPDPAQRRPNAVGWLEIAQRLKLKGVIATGWSRNNTHAPQKAPIDAALDALIESGVILHDGAPPARGREACLELLDALGERQRFEQCHAAMRALHEARRLAWIYAQWLQEQLALNRLACRDSGAGMGLRHWRHFCRYLEEAEAAGQQMRQAFAGLLSPASIEEYLAVRLEPLRHQHALMAQQME